MVLRYKVENVVLYLPVLILIVVANLGERDPGLRLFTLALLVLGDLALVGSGLVALLIWASLVFGLMRLPPDLMHADWLLLGLTAVSTGFLAALILLPPVRRGLVRVFSIHPLSLVHTVALACAIYQIGGSLGQLALVPDLNWLAREGPQPTLADISIGALVLTGIALAGVGLGLRRDMAETATRLKLGPLRIRHCFLAGGVALGLIVFQAGVSLGWEWAWPDNYQLINAVSERLYTNLKGLAGAVVLSASAGISEELLYRGALQPRLGLWATSLLFAVAHVQYAFSPATLIVFVIGLALGLLMDQVNTTAAVIAHVIYDFLGVLV